METQLGPFHGQFCYPIGCSGGEVVRYLWAITLQASCATIGFLWVPGRGCGALCSPRHHSRFLLDPDQEGKGKLRCSLFPATPLDPIIRFGGFASCPCSRCMLAPSWPMPARVLVPHRRHDSAAPRPYLHITPRSRVLHIYTAPQALLCGAVLCHGNHARIRTEPTRRLWTRIGCGPFADHDDAPPARSTPRPGPRPAPVHARGVIHPESDLTMIRQGVSSPHRSVSSRARNPIFS